MKRSLTCILLLFLLIFITACEKKQPLKENSKTGVYYEIFVRSFADSNNDKIGDFNGVTAKLDYLKDLGIEGIWLMPIFESNSYHGYDVINYYKLNEEYGTLRDFMNLLKEAKKRNIKIIIDLPINHTSNQHEWFQKGKNVDSKYHDYYVWIDESDARLNKLGAWNQNIWYKSIANNLYYAGYFSNDMPDLNMESPRVRQELKDIAKYWLEIGVDGFRLDAALHQYGINEYPSDVVPLSKNSTWWKEFKQALVKDYPDVYLVGEVWADSIIVAPFYYGLDSNFNFDVSDLIINSLYSYNSNYTRTIMRIHEKYRDYNSNFIDAVFLSNHDGNNKEPKARIASTFSGNEGRLKLAAEMLLTLPGNPFIYYGEELGMEGEALGNDYDKPLRSPMLWSKDGSQLDTSWYNNSNYNQGVKTVEEQLSDTNSLLNHYKRLINVRKSSLALHDGDMRFYSVGERNFQSFIRYYELGKVKDAVLVVHNVSNNELDLTFNNATKLKVIYESNGNNYQKNLKIGPRQTIIFEIPKELIDAFVRK